MRKPANKADAALCWCGTPIAGIPWPEQWVRASSATGDCRLEPNGRVAAGVTVVGCLAQSPVAGGREAFEINVWATSPAEEAHGDTLAPWRHLPGYCACGPQRHFSAWDEIKNSVGRLT